MNRGTAIAVAGCSGMAGEAGKCVLVVDGRKFDGMTFAIEWDGGPQAFGFLNGRTEALKTARTASSVALELEDGMTIPVAVLQVSPGGMALVVMDPRNLPPRSGNY